MEEAPKQNQEAFLESADAPYKEERDAGYDEAETIISEKEGYANMDYRERFSFLKEELENTTNRFAADYFATAMRVIELEEEQEKTDADLEKLRSQLPLQRAA